jgi:cellulose biosynthesis protein BcsQ
MFDQIAHLAEKYQALANIIGLLLGTPLIITLIQRLTRSISAQQQAKERIAELEGCNADLERTVNSETSRRKQAESSLSSVLDLFENETDDVWTRAPLIKPKKYSKLHCSIPIMVVANLKGGVGKTTLATNLAAYCERKRGERVLAIDLDYQGSMSSMLLSQNPNREKRGAKAVKSILKGSASPNQILVDTFPIRDTRADSRILECETAFSNLETKILFDWILGKYPGDCRYCIADLLLSEEIQTKFNRVIIDAPPRITTGFIAALCAATHLVIPTVLDVLSAERVGLFLADIKRWQAAEILGSYENNVFVVGTMKGTRNGALRDSEMAAVEEIKKQLIDKLGSDHYFLKDNFIPRKEDVAEAAGLRIAYFDDPSVFDPVFDILYQKTKRDAGNHNETGADERAFATL